jgi:hypothetical protein
LSVTVEEAALLLRGLGLTGLTVIVALKGRGWILLGALALGVVPVVGFWASDAVQAVAAARLALPESHWAKWRYGPRRRREARIRHPEAPDRAKDRYVALAGFTVAVMALGAIWAVVDPSILHHTA